MELAGAGSRLARPGRGRSRIAALVLIGITTSLVAAYLTGTDKSAVAMYGGTDAPLFPFVGDLGTQVTSEQRQQGFTGAHLCETELIAPQIAMTAWHCVLVAGPWLARMAVRFGSDDRNSGGFVAGLMGQPYHLGDDIGLLWLSQPVPYQPVALPSQTPAAGTATLQLGWGLTCSHTTPRDQCGPADLLQQLPGQVVSCSQADPALAHPLCTETPPGTYMQGGDSGGPALVNVNGTWQLAGILSGFPRLAPGQTPPPENETWYSDVATWSAGLQTIIQNPGAYGMPMLGRAWAPAVTG